LAGGGNRGAGRLRATVHALKPAASNAGPRVSSTLVTTRWNGPLRADRRKCSCSTERKRGSEFLARHGETWFERRRARCGKATKPGHGRRRPKADQATRCGNRQETSASICGPCVQTSPGGRVVPNNHAAAAENVDKLQERSRGCSPTFWGQVAALSGIPARFPGPNVDWLHPGGTRHGLTGRRRSRPGESTRNSVQVIAGGERDADFVAGCESARRPKAGGVSTGRWSRVGPFQPAGAYLAEGMSDHQPARRSSLEERGLTIGAAGWRGRHSRPGRHIRDPRCGAR